MLLLGACAGGGPCGPGSVIINPLFEGEAAQQVEGGAGVARRVLRPSEDATIVSDRIGKAEFRFFRLGAVDGADGVQLLFERPLTAVHRLGKGLAVQIDRPGGGCIVWIPRSPVVARFDAHGRVRLDGGSTIGEVSEDEQKGTITFAVNTEAGADVCLSAVVLPHDENQSVRELRFISQLRHATLLKSDWFSVGGPDELWEQLIDGDLFDPRPNPALGMRFPCQQCALAWWSYLQKLHRETGSRLLRLLAREVAWSARARFLSEGEWVHGFWCEQPETHLRFVLDGIHLLISEGEVGDEVDWILDAERALDVVIRRYSDAIDRVGMWFLHDSLELEFGKKGNGLRGLDVSPGNTLCLNTHVQALTVLNRLRNRTDTAHPERCETAYRQGMMALEAIIALHPAEVLYAILGKVVISAVSAKNRPGITARLRRILFFRLMRKPYWWVRRTFPRIVYPNGFIERDMTSSMLADDYHILNLKDLLQLYAQDARPWMERPIEDGMRFASRLDITRALARSPLFIEYQDVLELYDRLFGGIDAAVVDTVARAVRERWSGASLDACINDMIVDEGDRIPDLENFSGEP